MIVDASVVLAALLREPLAEQAMRAIVSEELAAPTLLKVEVGNVLSKRVRGRSITKDAAADIWSDFAVMPIRLVDDLSVIDSAFELSLRLHATCYDCLYLALALEENDVLVTADNAFIEAVKAAPDLAGRASLLGDA